MHVWNNVFPASSFFSWTNMKGHEYFDNLTMVKSHQGKVFLEIGVPKIFWEILNNYKSEGSLLKVLIGIHF